MHQLNRALCHTPKCLRKYQYGQDRWEDLSNDDRQEIRTALEEMQRRRCAYCECDLEHHGQHIEHFRQRHRYVQGTFDWNNLFWSCERGDSCGKHKDVCEMYDYRILIKPDDDDPEQFFLFVNDGTISVREGLTVAQRHRAEETLRIFNLDARGGPLRQMRRAAVSGYLKGLEELQELSTICSPEELKVYRGCINKFYRWC
jgi:uncharacterized protein (TIGR02646 family)